MADAVVSYPGADERARGQSLGQRTVGRVEGGARDDAGRESAAPIVLTIENMHCGGCMRKVETALSAVSGVQVRASQSVGEARHGDPGS